LRLTGHQTGLPAADVFMTLRRLAPDDIPL
jgi:hypothetical protein